MDRLPEEVIHLVLSFLPSRQVAKMAAVCKPLAQACSSFPILDFHIGQFLGWHDNYDLYHPPPMTRAPSSEIQKRFEIIPEYVDETMARFRRQCLRIHKFSFHYRYSLPGPGPVWIHQVNKRIGAAMDKWVGIALDNNAEEISVVCVGRTDSRYLISERILFAPSLKSLRLEGGDLSLSCSRYPPIINLKSLRSLTLEYFSITDDMFKRLVTACCALESLSVLYCKGLSEIRIFDASHTIKSLCVETSVSRALVEIEARNLESFHYSSLQGVDFGAVTMNHSPNLRSLNMYATIEDDEWLADFLSRFPKLESLTIMPYTVTRMRISNPLIKSIDLIDSRELTNIHLETPELTSFRLKANQAVPSIWMKDPRPRNCKANLKIHFTWELRPDWSCKLRELLARSGKYFKSLSLVVEAPNFCIELRREEDMNHKDQWLVYFPCNKDQLICSFDDTLSVSSILRELRLPPEIDTGDINGLLLIPHPKTIVMAAGLSGEDFLQVFFEKLGERVGNSRPCDSFMCQLECWQNGLLSDGKIEIIDRSNYKKAYPGI